MVTIQGKQYKAHYTLKAQMLWEKSIGRMFSPRDTYEIWVYYYFILVTCNEGFVDEYDLEKLLEVASEDPSIGEALLHVAVQDDKKKVETTTKTTATSLWSRISSLFSSSR